MILNYYECFDCGYELQVDREVICDDQCPECATSCFPIQIYDPDAREERGVPDKPERRRSRDGFEDPLRPGRVGIAPGRRHRPNVHPLRR
jgi:hypothetical protein